ncbi:MAG: hypothetical protein RR755_01315 [Erysipelotrichaceae bacterium]
MRLLLAIVTMFSLFSYDTQYPVTITSCEAGRIFATYQKETFEISLFNLQFNQAGKDAVCELIMDRPDMKIEIDASCAKQEPLPVYLFSKGVMIQETLLEQNKAEIAIANPEYKYAKRMKDAQASQKVMAKASGINEQETSKKNNSIQFLASLICLWISVGYFLLRNKLR